MEKIHEKQKELFAELKALAISVGYSREDAERFALNNLQCDQAC